MTKQKIWISFVSAALLVLVVWFGIVQTGQTKEMPISFQVSSAKHTQRINLWEDETGMCYVFLPSYAQLSQVRIRLNSDKPIHMNDTKLTDGMDCAAFSLDTPYSMSYTVLGKKQEKQVTFVQSANVAAMYIDTQSGSMDYIHEEKGNGEEASIWLYAPSGSLDYAGTAGSLKSRGNGTWRNFEKKAYSLDLAMEGDLLQMGQAQRWILLANAGDSSHLNNKIVYDFAEQAGLAYSPESEWVDLYLNGQYSGLYLLCERNEVHTQRVNITSRDRFLVSKEPEDRLVAQQYSYFVTDADQAFRIRYVEDTSIAESVMQSVENALLADDGIDPITGKSYLDLIDLDSWCRKYLIEEIFGNYDAGANSQFFYYDGWYVYAGPVWDYDTAAGNDYAWQIASPKILVADRLKVDERTDAPWYYNLCRKEAFQNRMKQLYTDEFLPLMETLLKENIYSYADHIYQASEMNRIRWFAEEADLYTQTEAIVAYMDARITFLNGVWIEERPYFRVLADQGFGANYANYIVFQGEQLTDLYMFEDTENSRFIGWYYKDTDKPFDVTQPITEDIEIYAKWEDTASNKMDDFLKLIPLGMIAVMGMALLWIECSRQKKQVTKNGATKGK